MHLLSFILLLLPCKGQTESFDEDLRFWSGDTAKFTIENSRLRSNSSITGDRFEIYKRYWRPEVFVWETRFELDLKTSSLNYIDLVLFADTLPLKLAKNACYLRVGGSKDNISLYARDSAGTGLLMTSRNGITEQCSMSVKVHYSNDELKVMFAEEHGVLELLGQAAVTIPPNGHSGLAIQQSSSSFFRKHFFDYFYLGSPIADTIPPKLISHQLTDDSLVLNFSESVLADSSTHFELDGNPKNGKIAGSRVAIDIFGLTTDTHYLSWHMLKDTAGNLSDSSLQFLFLAYWELGSGDLIINELLFDPYPGGVDFIEIHNRSAYRVALKNIDLVNALNQDTIDFEWSTAFIPPKGYLALTRDSAILCGSHHCKFPERIYQNELPRMNNDSGRIQIVQANKIIDAVSYSDQWHGQLLAATEGVSLERLHPEHPSNSAHNWHSASASSGFATPGYLNSQDITAKAARRFWLEQDAIVPNGLGNDLLIVHYSLPSAFNLNIYLFDLDGVPLGHLAKNELAGTNGHWKWDLKTDIGVLLSIGHYLLLIEAYNTDGLLLRTKLPFSVASQ